MISPLGLLQRPVWEYGTWPEYERIIKHQRLEVFGIGGNDVLGSNEMALSVEGTLVPTGRYWTGWRFSGFDWFWRVRKETRGDQTHWVTI